MKDVSALEHEAIDYERQKLVYREEKWLEKSGWKRTCSTPGSYWMWEKDWDGKTFLIMHKEAVMFQGIWDSEADCKANPEKYED